MKSATWQPSSVTPPEAVLPRSTSLPSLMPRWDCPQCHLSNSSASSTCVSCGADNMAADTERQWPVSNINEPQNRSPKRQSPSVYDRVKSKVSRSLSNGGVVQKRWTDSKNRPSSLIVESSSVSWNVNNIGDKNSWSCLRCTLVNLNHVDRCAVCEMPRKANVPGSFSTLPRSGVVITIPDWRTGSVRSQRKLPLTPVKGIVSLGVQDINSSPVHSLWTKPIYRRSLSEVLPADSALDNKINRRSLVETDAQGNIQPTLQRPANNLNLKLTPINRSPNTTRYSYIGISEPVSRSPQALAVSKLGMTTGSIVVDLADKKTLLNESIGAKNFERMWTCIKCSYAYNPIWSEACDICNSVRTPPSLTEPSLITVTKDSVRYTPPKEGGLENGSESGTDNHLQQDLEDDFQFLPGPNTEDWTCKKCTLVNSGSEMACVVCGGSKLRSITLVRDMTLRKGEFWTCPQCTLKNPLSSHNCQVCKTTVKPPKLLEVPSSKHTPRSPSPRQGQKYKSSAANPALGAIPKQRPTRKPGTPRSGAHVRHSRSGVIGNYSNGSVTNELAVIPVRSPSGSWHCVHCTYENRTASVACEMCQSTRSLSTSVSPVAPGTPVSSPAASDTAAPVKLQTVRQESELMEDLRHIEEREALEKWKRIVQYCKEVGQIISSNL